MKTQWSRSQIEALVAQLREEDQSTNSFLDFIKNTVSGARIVSSDVFTNFVQVSSASGWRTNPLMGRGGLGSFDAIG